MSRALDIVHALTDYAVPTVEKRALVGEFSREFGWRPNDFLEIRNDLAAASLVVEQGLENAAVLSFLPSDTRLQDLQVDERRSLLGLSYNSLVDWHVWIDRQSIQYVYNRTDPPAAILRREFNQADYSALAKSVFDQATGLAPNPNLPALDEALLETISIWRRILLSELGNGANNAAVAALFNGIILARAVEDFQGKLSSDAAQSSLRAYAANPDISIGEAIERSIVDRLHQSIGTDLLNPSVLASFDSLSVSSRSALIESFYRHRAVPYDYDFSVMSKHALSKIYERYVAVMQHDETLQFSLFPSAPDELWNKRLGGIYTPQYIASFFARYLQRNALPQQFLDYKISDPACGSGIFLRATMEQKLQAGDSQISDLADPALNSLSGIDIDENAVAAARLSLALLYLAARGSLPQAVPIQHGDSIEIFAPSRSPFDGAFDAVMVNPPFVRTELQTEDLRRAIADHVAVLAKGKLDTYLAFLTLSIRSLRPGGFGFFVVPQSLLTSDSLSGLREWIRETAWVRVIADLSAIRVFQASVYVALLIVQRKEDPPLQEPPVSYIRCQRDVGLALEDFLDGKRLRTSSYVIFDTTQASLGRATWSVSMPEEARLRATLDAMAPLSDVAVVRQGAITGADDVFVTSSENVPPGEAAVYRPFLPDRMIGRFSLPEETGLSVFYPFLGDELASAAQLETEFPITWDRLRAERARLSDRAPVRRGNVEWWQLAWPRLPREMMVPKVVAPEVSLLPRFGVDLTGRWVVSHSPFVRPRSDVDEEMLFILAAILNSSVASWFFDDNARKFRSGYNKLTVSLLKRFPIPDFGFVRQHTLRRVADLTRDLASASDAVDRGLLTQLDELVLRDLYQLTDDEVALLVT